MRRPLAAVAAGVALAALVAGCGGSPSAERPGPSSPATSPASPGPSAPGSSPAPPSSDGAATPTTPAPAPPPGTVPPPWLGERVLPVGADGYGEIRPTPRVLRHRRFTLPDPVPPLPGRGFDSRVVSPAPARVLDRSTWAPGCPVGRADLAWLRVTFRGFDGERHTGELLVHRSAAADLAGVFEDLWRADFPFERIAITTRAELDAPPTGDGNDSGGFVCRQVTGGTTYSQHALGLALDLNPFQNPYQRGDLVLPELASSYLDRSRVRPGMILPGDAVVRAFARIGWEWGGAWRTLKDYQHFSATGR